MPFLMENSWGFLTQKALKDMHKRTAYFKKIATFTVDENWVKLVFMAVILKCEFAWGILVYSVILLAQVQ